MTNSSSCSNRSIATHRAAAEHMAGIYKYILVRRTAAYSIIIIYRVQVLCCETTHGAYETKRDEKKQYEHMKIKNENTPAIEPSTTYAQGVQAIF